MSPAQSAFVMLATLFGVFGFSMPFSAFAMPPLPSFRNARRMAWALAATGLFVCVMLLEGARR